MPVPRLSGPHALSLAVAAAIAMALVLPVSPMLEAATQGWELPFDKLVHLALFLVAAVPWRRSFERLGLGSPGVAVVVTAALYGGLLELVQGLWTPRDAEVGDLLAGALGATVAVGILRVVRARPRA